jgi:hypothetical protein
MDYNTEPHPGMNAALPLGGSYRKRSAAGGRPYLGSARLNEDVRGTEYTAKTQSKTIPNVTRKRIIISPFLQRLFLLAAEPGSVVPPGKGRSMAGTAERQGS